MDVRFPLMLASLGCLAAASSARPASAALAASIAAPPVLPAAPPPVDRSPIGMPLGLLGLFALSALPWGRGRGEKADLTFEKMGFTVNLGAGIRSLEEGIVGMETAVAAPPAAMPEYMVKFVGPKFEAAVADFDRLKRNLRKEMRKAKPKADFTVETDEVFRIAYEMTIVGSHIDCWSKHASVLRIAGLRADDDLIAKGFDGRYVKYVLVNAGGILRLALCTDIKIEHKDFGMNCLLDPDPSQMLIGGFVAVRDGKLYIDAGSGTVKEQAGARNKLMGHLGALGYGDAETSLVDDAK